MKLKKKKQKRAALKSLCWGAAPVKAFNIPYQYCYAVSECAPPLAVARAKGWPRSQQVGTMQELV